MKMINPFEIIDARLSNIESLLLDLSRCEIATRPPIAELVTADELRSRLNICKASERSYVQAGILIPQHLGRRVYYRWDEVTAALSAKSDDLLPPKLRKPKTV